MTCMYNVLFTLTRFLGNQHASKMRVINYACSKALKGRLYKNQGPWPKFVLKSLTERALPYLKHEGKL